MKKYTIRPLEWDAHETSSGGTMHVARNTIFQVICAVCRSKSGAVRVFRPGDGWDDCASVEEGKRISEAHYLARLLPALSPAPE